MKKNWFSTVVIASVFLALSLNEGVTGTFKCERYQKNLYVDKIPQGIKSSQDYENWFPKNLILQASEFGRLYNSKAIGAQIGILEYRLLPSGKLLVLVPAVKNASGRYKCNMKPQEVIALGVTAKNNYKRCISGEDVQKCDDKDLCNLATTTTYGRNNSETKIWAAWKTGHVLEAKERGLTCNVHDNSDIHEDPTPTTSTTSSSTSSTPTTSSSKLDKAKSTCTELGFTLGTEKHGDCVLKMMDN